MIGWVPPASAQSAVPQAPSVATLETSPLVPEDQMQEVLSLVERELSANDALAIVVLDKPTESPRDGGDAMQ